MTISNEFFQDNITNVTRFLSEKHVSSWLCLPLMIFLTVPKQKFSATNEDNNDHWLGITSDDTDAVVLHRFFHRHADKIGNEPLSFSKPCLEGDTSTVTGKRVWDGLCALLVDLGPPMEVPHLSDLTSDEHEEYSDLMTRQANRDTASVEGLFVETDVCVHFYHLPSTYHTAVQLLYRIGMQYLSFYCQASTYTTSTLNYSCIIFSMFVIIEGLNSLDPV